MSFSRLIRIVQLGLKSLLLHKLRSGLTMGLWRALLHMTWLRSTD